MNNITVIGNVGRDPELRIAPSGTQVAEFSVADTVGKDDDKKTTWHDIVVFGDQAENVCESVKKGSRVVVIGRLTKDSYDGKDGEKKTKVEVIASDVAISLRWGTSSSVQRSAAPPEEPF